jgi:hypothetical protein
MHGEICLLKNIEWVSEEIYVLDHGRKEMGAQKMIEALRGKDR